MENFGRDMEAVAARYLATAHGWHLLERNVRFREGEIDLIMLAADGLKFVEVKARRSEKFGGVVESLTTQKIQRLRRAIYRWRERSGRRENGQMIFLGILAGRDGGLTMEELLIE
jgi:putative endonuclease